MNFTDINIGTPALLFPAISLLMLAYTNRFLTLASIIRSLYDRYHDDGDRNLLHQIANLRYRVSLIRNMQIYGVLSLIFCITSMLALFVNQGLLGGVLFAVALLLMIVSLGISLRELRLSGGALDILLQDLEENRSIDASALPD